MIGSKLDAGSIVDHPVRQGFPSLEQVTRLVSSRTFLIPTFLLLLAHLAYRSAKGITIFDEGIICAQAERVLHGGIPYRDFWSVYGPGQLYVLACLFKLFGTYLLFDRIYNVAVQWVIVLLSYGISDRFSGPLGALASSITTAIWLQFDRAVLYPVVPALMFALMAFLVAARFPWSRWHNFLAGVLMGCSTLMRDDYGVYGFSALIILFLGQSFWRGGSDPIHASSPLKDLSKSLLVYLSGFLVIVGLVFIALMWTVPHNLLYQAFVDYPFHGYSQYRSLPFPFVQEIESIGRNRLTVHAFSHLARDLTIYGLALLIPIATAALVYIHLSMARREPKRLVLGVAILVFDVGLWHSASVRPGYEHMVTPMVVALILFPWLLHMVLVLDVPWSLRSLFASLVLAPVAILSLICFFDANLSPWTLGVRFCPLEIDRARGISVTQDESTTGLADAIHYIREKTGPMEPIFVGNSRHDRLVLNAAMFYFLSARDSATRYIEMDPGIATTANVQSEIEMELRVHSVKYIVLWAASQPNEPNLSSRSDSTILDQFIHTNYQPVAKFGAYSILYGPSLGRSYTPMVYQSK